MAVRTRPSTTTCISLRTRGTRVMKAADPATSDLGAGTTFAPEAGDEKYIPPMAGEYFDIILFEANVPILEKRYTLILPPEKRLHSEIYNAPLYANTTYDADETRYSWWVLDMPARPNEVRRASLSDFGAKVVVATVESWEKKSRWFFDANRNQFDVTPEIQAKVDSQRNVLPDESDDPVMPYVLEVRFRRHWKTVAYIFHENEFRAIRSPVIAALQAAGVEVGEIDSPWDQ